MLRPTLYTMMVLPQSLICTAKINDENCALSGPVVSSQKDQIRTQEILKQVISEALTFTDSLQLERFA
jgi:hypothetical protein